MSRRGHVLSAMMAIAVAGSIVGCTPQSAPSPSPSTSATAFSSDAEAFAAAEATYRAYVDATNLVDLARPETFEEVYPFLSGEALRATRSSFTEMSALGWRVGGQSVITSLLPERMDDDSVALLICIDVSSVTLVDSAGTSQIGERPTEQSLRATVARSSDAGWQIQSFSGRTGDPQCKS